MATHLPRSRNSILAALAVASALFACTDHDQPVGPHGLGGLNALNPGALARPEERRAVELSRQIPGLAGFVYDTTGNLVVSVKTSPGPAVTRGLLLSIFRQELTRSRRRHPGADVILHAARFTFLELRDWRDRLEAAGILTAPGVSWVDLDEAANRVAIGLDATGDPGAVRRIAESVGVPAEVVDIESGSPYVAQTSLQDQFRPMQGGIQIQRVSGTSRATCTLGFNALWNSQQVFLTAGHCSPNLMGTDSVEQFQPLAPLTHADSATMTGIGREIFRYSAACGNNTCAYSDAAIYGPVPNAAWNLGHIAHPTSGCFPGPCSPAVLTVAGAWVIDTARASFVVNDLVSKIGSSTGWSQGTVTRTCVDVSPTHGVTYFCQMFANYGANDGDSGSPILLDIQGGTDTTVTLGGIHSGKSGNNSVFSPWSGIAHDYGSLNVVAPPPGPPVPSVAPDSEPVWIYDDTNVVTNLSFRPDPFVKNLVTVLFDPAAPQGIRQSAINAVGGTVVGGLRLNGIDGFYLVSLPPDSTPQTLVNAIATLKAHAGVLEAVPDIILVNPVQYLRPNDGSGWHKADWKLSPDSAFGSSPAGNWGLVAVNAPLAWGCTSGDPSVQVAVIDEGLDSVSDLRGNVGIMDGVYPGDTAEHGIAVASVIGAVGNNGQGITGMMWRARLELREISARNPKTHKPIVHDSVQEISLTHVVQAFVAAAYDGARVINISLGRDTSGALTRDSTTDAEAAELGSEMHQGLVEYAANADPLLVIAAGDIAGTDAYWTLMPTVAESLLSRTLIVTAAGRQRGTLWAGPGAKGSSVGSLVQLAAPGDLMETLGRTSNGLWSGTSLAAPIVSGIGGLLLSFDSTLSASTLHDLIIAGAQRGGRTAGTFPLVNAYEALKLAAQRPGAPICGNRVWASGTKVRAQRDTSDHIGEALVDLQDSAAYVNAFHGGHRIEVFVPHVGARAYKYSNGAWIVTTDTAVTPNGGTYLSVQQWSHDLDSAAVVQIASEAEGLTTLDVSAYIASANQTNHIATLSIPLSTASPLCIERFTDGQQCLIQGDAGGRESPDWSFAFSPAGGKILVAITKSLEVMTSNSGFYACPWNELYDPSPHTDCSNVNYQTQTEGTDIWEVDNTGGSPRIIFSIPGEQVFWLGVSEDGQQIVTAEAQVQTTTSWEPNPLWPQDPTYADEVSTSQQQITGCGVVFRRYSDGAVLLPLVPNSGACGFLQGQGTIAPAPKRSLVPSP